MYNFMLAFLICCVSYIIGEMVLMMVNSISGAMAAR